MFRAKKQEKLVRKLYVLRQDQKRVTYDMRELRAVWVIDRQILHSTTELVHTLHVPSQPTTGTGNITQTANKTTHGMQ